MGSAITTALALCRALRIILFGVWLIQLGVRFRFLRLFSIFMAPAWAAHALCGGMLFRHRIVPLI
jgi:hypothetical protein